MIKKQRKWSALLVLCTFLWVMQVSSMPSLAAGPTAQVSSANAEQGPDVFEAISQKAAPAKKKSILPYVLIGVGVVAVTAVLLFVLLKSGYDVRGTWKFDYVNASGAIWYTSNMTFSGTKESGTVVSASGNSSTYSVVDKTIKIANTGGWAKHTATFSDKDAFSGTWERPGEGGNFNATRIADAASVRNPAGTGSHMPPLDRE